MPTSRRRFLQVAGSSGLILSTGCSGGVLGGYEWEVAWPPQEPYSKPSLDEVPDLTPPSLGNSGDIPVEIYHDVMTQQAGVFFEKGLDRLEKPIKEGKLSLTYRDSPLPANNWTYPVAIAGRAVQHYEGEAAFWDFYQEILVKYNPEPHYYMSKEDVLTAAENVGAPREKIREDTESWRFYSIIQRDLHKAQRLGIANSVPNAIIGEGENQVRDIGYARDILWQINDKFE